jgi:transcriptional regulator with XRE-family HTH domain
MRQWLIDKRLARGLTRSKMAKECQCSRLLLQMLEEEDVITHPDIAAWVAQEYGLALEEYHQLVHEMHWGTAIPEPKAPPTLEEFYADKYRRMYQYKNK